MHTDLETINIFHLLRIDSLIYLNLSNNKIQSINNLDLNECNTNNFNNNNLNTLILRNNYISELNNISFFKNLKVFIFHFI